MSKGMNKLNREVNRDIHLNARGFVDKAGWSSLKKKSKAPLTPEQQIAKFKRKQSYVAGGIWLAIWAVTITVLSVVVW